MPNPKANSRPIRFARLLGNPKTEVNRPPFLEHLEEIKVITYLIQEFDLTFMTDSPSLIELSLEDFYFTVLSNINFNWFPLNQYMVESIEYLDHDWLPDPIPVELFGNDPEDEYVSRSDLKYLFFMLMEWNQYNRDEFQSIYPSWPLPPDDFKFASALRNLQTRKLPRPLPSIFLVAKWIDSSTGNFFLDESHSSYYYNWAFSWRIANIKKLRAEWKRAIPLLALLEELENYASHEDNLRKIYDLIIGAT